MGLGNKKTKNAEKVKKALDVLKDRENLRKVYDYNLIELANLIKEELEKRAEKKKIMINCLEDMCRWLQENEETENTFLYSPQNPEQLMEAYDDEITDEGFDQIYQQIEGKEILTFEYEGRIFRVKSYIDLDKRTGMFEMEEILAKVEKKL